MTAAAEGVDVDEASAPSRRSRASSAECCKEEEEEEEGEEGEEGFDVVVVVICRSPLLPAFSSSPLLLLLFPLPSSLSPRKEEAARTLEARDSREEFAVMVALLRETSPAPAAVVDKP
jgi:hypothetical protein